MWFRVTNLILVCLFTTRCANIEQIKEAREDSEQLLNEIATLVNGEKHIGSYEVKFNGIGLPSGINFYRLQTARYIETKKMVLMK